MVSRVRVTVGATVPGLTQYSSSCLELFEETDVSELSDPNQIRKALYEKLNAELEEWKKTLLPPKPKREWVRVEAESVPVGTISAENPYEKSNLWRQSTKKKNLRTIRITQEVLNNPDLKRLIEMVRETKTLQVLNKRYTIWKSEDGQEFLSEWSRFT